MLKELIATQLASQIADVQSVLREIVTRGEARGVRQGRDVQRTEIRTQDRSTDRRFGETFESTRTDGGRTPGAATSTTTTATPTAVPSSEQVQRSLQSLQQQAGLPVTGRFDEATNALLRSLGIVPASTSTPVDARKTVDATQQAAGRQKTTAVEQQVRSRVQQQLPGRAEGAQNTTGVAQHNGTKPIDRVLDPARLLASLFAAGFTGAGAEQALASFQNAHKLPPSGALDPRTVDALVSAGHLPGSAADVHADLDQQRAATSTSTTGLSQRGRADPTRAPAHAGEGHAAEASARKSTASAADARERARVESLLAEAAATERGVQTAGGDPSARRGHGQTAGATTGLTGAGGEHGGVDAGGDEDALRVEGDPPGDESSSANADSGDDDHDDPDRGEAVAAHGDIDDDDDDAALPDGHHRVPRLGVQVRGALETIQRIDDGCVPVHYTWDTSLYRPGVYADGQAADVIWHLVVDRAHAFDPVWQRAVDAIGARLLYLDPDAEPLTLDELLAALRRARVR
jgi:hypothetical protein